jgi:heme A synthase
MVLFRRLTAITAFFIFVEILLGAVTRLTDSGISCPDWPLCYGLWFPTPDKLAALPEVNYTFGQVMSEWLHRFNAAAVVAPLTVVLFWLAWRMRMREPALFEVMLGAVLVLLVQAGLGGFTVLDRNSAWSVAIHLSVALLLLALVLRAHVIARGLVAAPAAVGRVLAAIAAALALVTVASGAVVAKSDATLACSTWPLCDGLLIPDTSDFAIKLNFGHRLLSLATGLFVFALWSVARHADGGARGPFLRAATMALFVLVLQVGIGAAVPLAFAGGSLWPQVVMGTLHQAFGVVLFATLVVMAWLPAMGAYELTADAGGA